MKVRFTLVVVLVLLALSTAALPAMAAKTDHFNDKFTFTGVTLDDGTTTVDNGIIEASSKSVDHSQLTVCDYYTAGYMEYLGQFQSSDFASSDPTAVENFCQTHFADRQ